MNYGNLKSPLIFAPQKGSAKILLFFFHARKKRFFFVLAWNMQLIFVTVVGP